MQSHELGNENENREPRAIMQWMNDMYAAAKFSHSDTGSWLDWNCTGFEHSELWSVLFHIL